MSHGQRARFVHAHAASTRKTIPNAATARTVQPHRVVEVPDPLDHLRPVAAGKAAGCGRERACDDEDGNGDEQHGAAEPCYRRQRWAPRIRREQRQHAEPEAPSATARGAR